MNLRDRVPPLSEDGAVSPWAVAAAVAAGAALAGLAYFVTRRKPLVFRSWAHASDGARLATRCVSSQDGGEALCSVNVRRTTTLEIASQTGSQSAEGPVLPDEGSPIAKEVCLHIQVAEGDFASAPEYADGTTAAHVRNGRELIIFLGDMQPSDEISVSVRARPAVAP